MYIRDNDISLLIDTPPELRLQLLRNNITTIDAVLFTHSHADHLMGLDDIRAINRLHNKSIPCYGNESTIKDIKKVFKYIFDTLQVGGGIPQVTLHNIKDSFLIGETLIQPLPIKHGKLDILGYKIDRIAYMTDCSYIPQETLSLLEGIDILIIDALRYKPHPTHMNVKQALDIIKYLGVPRAYLTHISHHLEHDKTNKELPSNVRLAYDGLTIEL